MAVIVDGLGFPESLRWHADALWYADWAAGTIFRLGADLVPQTVAQRASFPLCFDLVPGPDGPRPLLVSNADQAVVLPDGTRHAELPRTEHPWNEIVVAADGSAYVNNIGFAFGPGADPAAAGAVGYVVLVRADGSGTPAVDGLAFPNGMALIDGGATLLVAESYGQCLTAFTVDAGGELTDRRVWAATPGLHPDGIHAGTDGTVWLADVGTRCCVRVAAGGAQLDRIDLPRGAFDCVVGDLGTGPTLYVGVNEFGGDPAAGPQGQIHAVPLT
jgi:sugar lactone lactonase YvrE